MKKEHSIQLESLGVEMPYSMIAEQAVLGAAIADQEQLSVVSQLLRPEYFYSEKNQAVFEEIQRLSADGTGVDAVTLVEALSQSKEFSGQDEAFLYIENLVATVPSVSNAKSYAEIVAEKARLRQLISAARQTLENSAEADNKTLLEHAEQNLYALHNEDQGNDVVVLHDSLRESILQLHNLANDTDGQYKGIPTGFTYLDDALAGGLGRSDLIILAARPGMGKTSFALNIATNVAKDRNIPTVVFSLEMTRDQLTNRILSSEAGVESKAFRTGQLEDSDWEDLAFVTEKLSSAPLYLNDTSGISIGEMRAKLRILNQKLSPNRLGLIVVDYLQLMSSGRNIDNRVQEVSEITRNLKIIAKEFNAPVLALSQLSRAVEKNSGGNKRPQLSDLRDSGSIEQDADIVLFLYREAYYESTGSKSEDSRPVNQNIAECIVAKNRHGEVRTVKIGWDGSHTRFTNVDFTHEG